MITGKAFDVGIAAEDRTGRGSGFLGELLESWFTARNWEVAVLSRRSPRPACRSGRWVKWDGRSAGEWEQELEGAAAVINLAGRSVDCRYTRSNRREILASRVDSTRALGEAIVHSARPPAIWLQSSTATIYKHSHDRPMDEIEGETGATPEAKDAFSVEVARAWEETANSFHLAGTRLTLMRTSMVFAIIPGGVFHVLRRLARCGLGGTMAGGSQIVSWIHEADFCRAVQWLIEHPSLSGVVNLAAPNPLPNREMMRGVRSHCGLPLGIPIPLTLLEIGAFLLRTETELVIKSRRVVPRRLLESGFRFEYPEFEPATEELEQRSNRRKKGDGSI